MYLLSPFQKWSSFKIYNCKNNYKNNPVLTGQSKRKSVREASYFSTLPKSLSEFYFNGLSRDWMERTSFVQGRQPNSSASQITEQRLIIFWNGSGNKMENIMLHFLYKIIIQCHMFTTVSRSREDSEKKKWNDKSFFIVSQNYVHYEKKKEIQKLCVPKNSPLLSVLERLSWNCH